MDRLQWRQDGLTVELHGLAIEPGSGFWMRLLTGQGVHLERLSAARLRIDDRRPTPAEPAPLQPLTTLELPLPVSVALALDTGIGPHGSIRALRRTSAPTRARPNACAPRIPCCEPTRSTSAPKPAPPP